MIKVLIADMFKSEMHTLVNTVNCVGVMGKGIALLFKKAYPDMFKEYQLLCDRGDLKLGEPYHYKDLTGSSVLNFPTKGHWRSSTRLLDIENGLDHFIRNYKEWGIQSIAFAPLGCGNGGLDWKVVGPLMWNKLQTLDIPVEIYAPFGTPNNQLKDDFLSSDQQLEFQSKGTRLEAMKPQWAALVETLYQLECQPHAKPVGRTIFQKICYVLTKQGLDTGFQFEKNSYGPYADEVKLAISSLANKNWLLEEQKGRMNAMSVGLRYRQDRNKILEKIEPYQKKISKTVDLFSRIQNTNQAEEVATVIFSVQQLKADQSPDSVTEKHLFDYILNWKQSWKKDISKQHSLTETIRSLEMLSWVKLKYSDSLPTSAETT